MLAFLEALRDALVARDSDAIRRLLAHPLAGILPDGVRAESERILRGQSSPVVVPIATLQLLHQTAHCLGVVREGRGIGADEAKPGTRRRPASAQMELPLQVA